MKATYVLVHAHHENTSSIKINFKFLTVSLFHYSYKQPFSFQQVLRWAWNKLNMHLKLYYIPKVFSDWISSHNLYSWLAENISRFSLPSFITTTHTCSELLTYMIFIFDLNGFFEFVQTNRSSHRDLFLKNTKLLMNL